MTNDKIVYNKIKLLSGFLEENNQEIIDNIEKELLALPGSTLSVLKEYRCDENNTLVCEKLDEIIKKKERQLIFQKLILWKKNNEDVLRAFFIMSEFDMQNEQPLSEYFKIDNIIKQIFLNISEEASPDDIISKIHLGIVGFLKKNQVFKNIKQKFFSSVLPDSVFDRIFLSVLFKSVSEKLSYPIDFLKTDSGFALGFKNTGKYKILFIENPYLLVFIPDFENLHVLSPQEALAKNIIKDFEPLNNTDFLCHVLGQLQKNNPMRPDEALWYKEIQDALEN